jgi:cytochrome b6-f complex iron-sulfur subunit
MSDDKANPAGANADAKREASRRDVLNEITWGALGIAGLGAAALTFQFFSPNVLFELPTTFRAGDPDRYPVNSVTLLQDQLIYIVRTASGFYAVSAVCTHLGCITQWKPEVNTITCPCHSSKFQPTGERLEGPAPLPLPHYAINFTADGELQVDKLQIIKADQVLKA